MKKFIAVIAAAFTTTTPAPSYQEKQAQAHAEWDAWNQEKQAKNEIRGLESWFIERNRTSNTQAWIDNNDRRLRSTYQWVNGVWKLVGYKNESCIIRK
jgi:hypothetical protein